MAEALISVLLEQLASVVFEHTKQAVTLILNAEEEVQNFSSNLKVIQAVLEDAEKKQVTEASVRVWLQKLKDVSYEMDDVLDEWNTAILRQQVEDGDNTVVTKMKVCFPTPARCFCFGKPNYYHNIARRIKDLNERLNVIAAEKDKHNFLLSAIPSTGEELIQHQKTSSLVDVSTIFGREEEKKLLLRKLLRESNQDEGKFLVIPIVGMGGMGKTTLAQLVYNDERVKNHYGEKVWVCVSDPFDEIKIAKAIIESLGGDQSSSNELETLLLSIKTRVGSKKFLLVLDDVWTQDKNKWDNLKLPVILQSCTEGSTILVTTRKGEVAQMIRATNNMIPLDKLNDEDSLALFNSIAFLDRKEDEANGFGAIGEKIVGKCKGVPLVIKTLGSLVWCKKTIGEWRDVLNSRLWELEEVEDQVFRPLLLSYYDLAPAVKTCLLYCAIFPKDAALYKNKLIELWMSQGFLNSKRNKEERRNGENYFESLAMRSFFQDFKKDNMGNVYECKMHDIVHDFVQFLNKKECVTIEAAQIEGENQSRDLSGDKVRHLTLTKLRLQKYPHASSCYGCKNIRTLTVLDSEITTISLGSILQMKCLRTLNLSRNSLIELPKEVGKLIHLRYLDLSWNQELKEIPEAVCDLYNLQTLDLRHCSALEKLPKAMGKLINLKHLYVASCFGLRYLPKGIGSLKSLRVLDWFYGFSGEGENDEALKLGDLGIMDQLQGRLTIGGLGGNKDDAIEMEKAQLGNKEHLSVLEVWFERVEDGQRKGDSEMVKAIRPHENLELLSIECCHIDTTECLYWINSLHNLRQVSLSFWGFCQVLPPLGKLPSLEFLYVRFIEKVTKVGVEFLAIEGEQVSAGSILFPKLKRLFFSGLSNWEEWEGITHDSSDMITIMPRLSELRIWGCPKLRALPDFLYKITTLRTLVIVGCPILEGEYEKDVGKKWHNISHIPNLTIQSTW